MSRETRCNPSSGFAEKKLRCSKTLCYFNLSLRSKLNKGWGREDNTSVATATDLSDAYCQGDGGISTTRLSVHSDAARQISRLKPESRTLLCRQRC